MTLLGILAGVIGTVAASLIAYLGAKGVQRATARRTDAEADKTAVDGYDLLTGRLEARLSATEKRLAEVEAENRDLRRRAEHAEHEAEDCKRQVARLSRVLAAHGITEDTA